MTYETKQDPSLSLAEAGGGKRVRETDHEEIIQHNVKGWEVLCRKIKQEKEIQRSSGREGRYGSEMDRVGWEDCACRTVKEKAL